MHRKHDPLHDIVSNSRHVSNDPIENRKFQKALARIDGTIKQLESRKTWEEIIENAKRSGKPGSYLVMVLNASNCSNEKALEFLNALKQIAKREGLNQRLPLDKKADRRESENAEMVRKLMNELLDATDPTTSDNILETLSEKARDMLRDNGIAVIRKRTNGNVITACVSLEMKIPLNTGGNAYIVYNMPETLSEIAGWVSKNKKDVYVVDRSLGEGNGESKLSMRSRVSSTMQHELQHLFNGFLGFSLVDNEYSAYLAGFSFGRIRSKHMKMLREPGRRARDAARKAMNAISTALSERGIEIRLEHRKEIAEECRKLLEEFYLQKTGLGYSELIAPFTDPV